ncbi:MAG: DUF6440 family protein [Oscillospiraceae bacterium]
MFVKKEKRVFELKEKISGRLPGSEIIVDTKTGVNYISTGYSLTPLLDKDGKPVIDPVE